MRTLSTMHKLRQKDALKQVLREVRSCAALAYRLSRVRNHAQPAFVSHRHGLLAATSSLTVIIWLSSSLPLLLLNYYMHDCHPALLTMITINLATR